MARINVYDTQPNFQSIVNKIVSSFGSKGAVSEWAAQHGYPNGMTDSQYQAEIQARATILANSGISKAFLFTWRMGTNSWEFQEPGQVGVAPLHPGFAQAFPSSSTPPPIPPGGGGTTPPPTTPQKITGTLTGTFTGTFTGTIG